MQEKKSLSINLLKRDEESFIDKFLRWSLTVGRLLVILTEIVALSAFVYRFSLDRRLIDLRDEIRQKQTIVEILSENENRYRNLQDRILLASTYSEKAEKTNSIFGDFLGLAPGNVFIEDLSISEESVIVEASAPSIDSVTQFVEKIRAHESVTGVSIEKIENKTSSAVITVRLKANLQKQERS